MSVRINDCTKALENITLQKYKNNKNISTRAAFSENEKVEVVLCVPRIIGVIEAVLCVEIDGEGQKEIPFTFRDLKNAVDEYFLILDFASLFPNGSGLMFWKAKLVSSDCVYYTESINNVDFKMTTEENSAKFRILVHDKSFATPEWAKNSVMYQIFVDRFCKGNVKIPVRNDAKINDDWYDGIPEYSSCGEPIPNNTHFGGTLYGVAEKLDYLKELGVDVLYLNPVFEAYSNHKYDTADYEKIDEMFGGDEAFDFLVKEMKKRNMHLILDGVFNHTGSDSKYFNKKGKYKEVGAYQSKDSKYYGWYSFSEHPDKYESWWGIDILPRINGRNEDVIKYFLSQNGIVRKWLKRGADGFRLDVADELDDEFLTLLRNAAKQQKNDSFIVGEVWENPADKISYGKRRNYFKGHQLDSVMNYPIKEAIINFVMDGNAESFYNTVTDIYSSCPNVCCAVLMNILSSHDTVRILTRLAGENGDGRTKKELSKIRLTKEEYETGKKLLFFASILQFTLPGIPCIYYGDEIGMQGYSDPFCRLPYPWGREDEQIFSHYKKLCKIKKNEKSLHTADVEFVCCEDGFVIYERADITVLVNASVKSKMFKPDGLYYDLLCEKNVENELIVAPNTAKILKKKR